MAGSLPFFIYIDNLNRGLQGTISKFADNTRLGSIVNREEDSDGLQEDRDRLVEWASTWQIKFNVERCEVIHFGQKKEKRCNKIKGPILKEIQEQRDLGVSVYKSLKVAGQVEKSVNKLY